MTSQAGTKGHGWKRPLPTNFSVLSSVSRFFLIFPYCKNNLKQWPMLIVSSGRAEPLSNLSFLLWRKKRKQFPQSLASAPLFYNSFVKNRSNVEIGMRCTCYCINTIFGQWLLSNLHKLMFPSTQCCRVIYSNNTAFIQRNGTSFTGSE